MRVEVLYVKGCPHHAPTVDMVHEILEELGRAETVEQVRVEDPEAARRLGFPGSPTIRLDGEDVDPPGAAATQPSFSCRLYKQSGIRELVRAAILKRL